MRILLNELKKIANPRILLLIAVLGLSLFPEGSNVFSPVIHRAEQHYINTDERNLTRCGLHETFSFYAMLAGLFAVIAVLLLVSPPSVTDRRRRRYDLVDPAHKDRAI
jgi:hypothetical protein